MRFICKDKPPHSNYLIADADILLFLHLLTSLLNWQFPSPTLVQRYLKSNMRGFPLECHWESDSTQSCGSEIYPHINVMCRGHAYYKSLPHYYSTPVSGSLMKSWCCPWLIWLFDCFSLTAILTSLKCNYANRSITQGQSCTLGLLLACE